MRSADEFPALGFSRFHLYGKRADRTIETLVPLAGKRTISPPLNISAYAKADNLYLSIEPSHFKS